MEGIGDRYLNVVRQISGRLSERYWTELVDVSRTMTTDCVSLDDHSAVALAFSRAAMLSVSIESGSAYTREQGTCDRKAKLLAALALIHPLSRVSFATPFKRPRDPQQKRFLYPTRPRPSTTNRRTG